MRKCIQELLTSMGFKHVTGLLWKHEQFGIISFEDHITIEQVAFKIYLAGYKENQKNVRNVLGIKE